MKLRDFILTAILAGCLCGCEYYFPLEGLDDGAKLYVQCIAGNSDRTYINVQKAMGVNSTGSDILPDVESIVLKVNGRECSVERVVLPDPPTPGYYDPELGYVSNTGQDYPSEYYTLRRYNLWSTDAPIKEGDDLSLEVSARGMETVSANVSVPDKIVIQDVKAAARCSTITEVDYTYTEKFMSFDVSLANVSPDGFYGLGIECEETGTNTYSDGREETYSYSHYAQIITWSSATGMVDDLQESQGEWIDAYYNNYFIDSYGNGMMHLIKGDCLKDGHMKFDCSIPFSLEGDSDIYDYNDEIGDLELSGQVHFSLVSKYRLCIYRVSPEFYRYNKAQYLLRTNYLAEVGLSPSTFSYTNVRGGFGLLGALSVTTTPWYISPAEPE